MEEQTTQIPNNRSVRKNYTWPEIIEKILEKNNEQQNKGFRRWLETKEWIGYHADYLLWFQAYQINKKLNQKDNDHFTIISGLEGSGKTVLGMILAVMVSPTFSMKHICFSIQDFLNIIDEAQPGDTILLDEGAIFLFSREAMGKDNRKVIKLFNLIRQLRLHIIVCIPRFKTIDSYVREHRVDTLIHITEARKAYKGIIKRGIEVINDVNKPIHAITLPYGSFWQGYWTEYYPQINDLTEEAYRNKKKYHLKTYIKDIRQEVSLQEEVVHPMVRVSQFAKLVPQQQQTIIRHIQEGDIPGKKIGNMWYVDGNYYRNIMKKV